MLYLSVNRTDNSQPNLTRRTAKPATFSRTSGWFKLKFPSNIKRGTIGYQTRKFCFPLFTKYEKGKAVDYTIVQRWVFSDPFISYNVPKCRPNRCLEPNLTPLSFFIGWVILDLEGINCLFFKFSNLQECDNKWLPTKILDRIQTDEFSLFGHAIDSNAIS